MTDITQLLGRDAESLLRHRCITIPADQLYLPGIDYVDRMMVDNNRPPAMLRDMQTLCNTGRLGGTGYLSILPVDRDAEHSAGVSFAANPLHSNPKNIVELAIEASCNCAASTYGMLVSMLRHYVYRIPFLVRPNHNETPSYPTEYDQTLYASAKRAFNMGAVTVGTATYFSSEQSRRQIGEVSVAFERARELGLVTVLWAYLRNSAFKKDGVDYHVPASLTSQANHLAAIIGVDIIRQKMTKSNGGYKAVNLGYIDDRVYDRLISDNSIDLVRHQLISYYMGHAGLINSDGAAGEETDLADIVRTAAINKRAGGTGLILDHRAFKKSMADGVKLINVVQDVCLGGKVTIA